MPVVFAFFASALIHLSAMLSDGWTLPSLTDAEELEVTLPAAAVPESPRSVVQTAPPRHLAAKAVKKPMGAANLLPTVPPVPVAPDAPVAAPETQAAPQPASGAADAQPSSPADEPPALPALNALARLPASGQWRYTVTRGEGGLLIGQATYHWAHDGQHYQASSRTETVGIASLFASAAVEYESVGEITDAGLRPTRFRNAQKKRTDLVEIDHTAGMARSGEREWVLGQVALPVQDMLSMHFQLGLILAAASVVPGEIQLPILTGRKFATYRFELVGEEIVTRQFADYPTRHLRARNRDDIIDLWLTPALPLPLRVRISDRKGDVYEQWLEIP